MHECLAFLVMFQVNLMLSQFHALVYAVPSLLDVEVERQLDEVMCMLISPFRSTRYQMSSDFWINCLDYQLYTASQKKKLEILVSILESFRIWDFWAGNTQLISFICHSDQTLISLVSCIKVGRYCSIGQCEDKDTFYSLMLFLMYFCLSCVNVCTAYLHFTVHVWRPKTNFRELVLSTMWSHGLNRLSGLVPSVCSLSHIWLLSASSL